MIDLGAKLRILDELDAPSVWSDIEALHPQQRSVSEPTLWRHRLGTIAIAIAIGLAGIVIAVQRELGVPVKLVGLGEGPDDLAPFEPETFVDAIIGD